MTQGLAQVVDLLAKYTIMAFLSENTSGFHETESRNPSTHLMAMGQGLWENGVTWIIWLMRTLSLRPQRQKLVRVIMKCQAYRLRPELSAFCTQEPIMVDLRGGMVRSSI